MRFFAQSLISLPLLGGLSFFFLRPLLVNILPSSKKNRVDIETNFLFLSAKYVADNRMKKKNLYFQVFRFFFKNEAGKWNIWSSFGFFIPQLNKVYEGFGTFSVILFNDNFTPCFFRK